MAIKSWFVSLAALGLVVSMGTGCMGGGGTSPTPVPTAVVVPPATLLSLSNTGAVAANAAVFGGAVFQPFTVGTLNKVITVSFSSSAPVNLTFAVYNPSFAAVIPVNSTGTTQTSSASFTPVVAGVYNLYTVATAAIAAGTTVSVTVTQ